MVIRDESLRLFALHGPDTVTLRQMAGAGASPGLVIHHFGAKKGLREVVDQHVVATFGTMLGEWTAPEAADLFAPAATGSPAEVPGVDPLSRQGMTRWAGEMLTIYTAGFLRRPPATGGPLNDTSDECGENA